MKKKAEEKHRRTSRTRLVERASTRLHAKTRARRLIIPRESGNFPFYRSLTFQPLAEEGPRPRVTVWAAIARRLIVVTYKCLFLRPPLGASSFAPEEKRFPIGSDKRKLAWPRKINGPIYEPRCRLIKFQLRRWRPRNDKNRDSLVRIWQMLSDFSLMLTEHWQCDILNLCLSLSRAALLKC